jgi:hypothetical protein
MAYVLVFWTWHYMEKVCLSSNFCTRNASPFCSHYLCQNYNSRWFDHLAGDRVYGGIAILVWGSIHCCVVLLETTIQTVPVWLFTVAHEFTSCSMYLQRHSIGSVADLHHLLFHLLAPLLLLGDFSACHHLCSSIDKSKWVIEALVTGFNLVLKTGKVTHVSCFW